MGLVQLKNKNGVVINIDPTMVDRVRPVGKGGKTCFVDIGSVEIEVAGNAKAIGSRLSKAAGIQILVLDRALGENPAFAPKGAADGPFDLEAGLATDEPPVPSEEDRGPDWEEGLSA